MVSEAAVSTLAGGVNGATGAYADASGTNAGFKYPGGVVVDASGNVFVADSYNNRIRKVTAGGGTWIDPNTLHVDPAYEKGRFTLQKMQLQSSIIRRLSAFGVFGGAEW